MRVLLTVLATFAVILSAHADDDFRTEPFFRQLVHDNSFPLTVTADDAAGPGYDFLLDEGRQADFFLVGEAHGSADIAHLSRHLFEDLVPAGYGALAIEVGPWSTQVLESLLRDDDPRAYETYVDSLNTDLAFPFMFFGEELDLVRSVVRETEAPALWGLDQEFIFGSMIIADILDRLAETSVQTAATAAFRDAADAEPGYIGSADPASFDDLQDAFAGHAEGSALVEELYRTNRIYMPFTGRGGFSNLANWEREDRMKLNLIAAYNAARANGPAPRVMVKLGANHTSYGRSPTNVPGTGDFLHEWGLAEGLTVFNVHMDCRGGEERDIQTGGTVPCASYRLPDDSILASAVGELEGPVAVDLRSLRRYAHLWLFLDQVSTDLIFAYDVYVAFPNVTASRLEGEPLSAE